MKKALILCSENSCRSQISEGYLRFFTESSLTVFSAGLKKTKVNPFAIKVMDEDNIDISNQTSNNYQEYCNQSFDYLITVCEEARKKLPGCVKGNKYFHISVEDPATFQGSEDSKLEKFRIIREKLKRELLIFIGQELNADSARA